MSITPFFETPCDHFSVSIRRTVGHDGSVDVLACYRDPGRLFREVVGIRHRFLSAADAAAARSPRLSAWGLHPRPSQGREHGLSGSGVMMLRQLVNPVKCFRRSTANHSMFVRVPHAEAWGYALRLLRERPFPAICFRSCSMRSPPEIRKQIEEEGETWRCPTSRS